MTVEVFYRMGPIIKKRYGSNRLRPGHSGGYAAPVGDHAAILELLMDAVETTGYGGMFKIGLDCAASHLYDPLDNSYHLQEKQADREEIIRLLESLAESYPLFLNRRPP
jgi:enolase